MSWDLYGRCDHCASDLFDWNFTSNINPMLREAGIRFDEWDGRKAKEVASELENGIKAMLENPEKYRAMDAPNGWGTYAGTCFRLVCKGRDRLNHPLPLRPARRSALVPRNVGALRWARCVPRRRWKRTA